MSDAQFVATFRADYATFLEPLKAMGLKTKQYGEALKGAATKTGATPAQLEELRRLAERKVSAFDKAIKLSEARLQRLGKKREKLEARIQKMEAQERKRRKRRARH